MSQRPPGISVSQYYGQSFQPYGRANQVGPPGPMFDVDPVRRTLDSDRIVDACMRAKGYSPLEAD